MNATQDLHRTEKRHTTKEDKDPKKIKTAARKRTDEVFEPTYQNATQKAEGR